VLAGECCVTRRGCVANVFRGPLCGAVVTATQALEGRLAPSLKCCRELDVEIAEFGPGFRCEFGPTRELPADGVTGQLGGQKSVSRGQFFATAPWGLDLFRSCWLARRNEGPILCTSERRSGARHADRTDTASLAQPSTSPREPRPSFQAPICRAVAMASLFLYVMSPLRSSIAILPRLAVRCLQGVKPFARLSAASLT
jgi:hypothetical protein